MSRTLTARIGTDRTVRFLVSDPDTGLPEDITGFYCYLEVRDLKGVRLASWDNDAGGVGGVTIEDQVALTGKFRVSIHHDDFASVVAGTYRYVAIARRDPGGTDDRGDVAAGKFIIEPLGATIP